MKRFVIGFFAGIALMLGIIIGFHLWWPRPGPAVTTSQMTISPPAPSRPPAATICGQASGTARRIRPSTRPQETQSETAEGISPPPVPSPPPADGQALAGEEPTPSPTPSPPEPEPAFVVGDRAAGTIEGEIEIVDSHGRPVTTEALRVSGEYTLDFPAPGQAEISLQFMAPAVLELRDPLRAIRIATAAGWLADRPFAAVTGEYERRWKIAGSLAARATVEAGWAWTPERAGPVVRIEAGIEYKF